MTNDIWSVVNWMSYEEMKSILEDYGFSITPFESENDLRNAIVNSIEDGSIEVESILRG